MQSAVPNGAHEFLILNAKFLIASCAFTVAVLGSAETSSAATCENLKALSLQQATITAAQTVAAGAFTVPTPAGGVEQGRGARGRADGAAANPFNDLPPFCRVAATLTPTSDSDIKI